MLGKKRAQERGLGEQGSLIWVEGDAEKLNFEDGSMDGYTIAFGIRNVTHIEKVLAEAYRVLKKGGRFLCLELSHRVFQLFWARNLQRASQMYYIVFGVEDEPGKQFQTTAPKSCYIRQMVWSDGGLKLGVCGLMDVVVVWIYVGVMGIRLGEDLLVFLLLIDITPDMSIMPRYLAPASNEQLLTLLMIPCLSNRRPLHNQGRPNPGSNRTPKSSRPTLKHWLHPPTLSWSHLNLDTTIEEPAAHHYQTFSIPLLPYIILTCCTKAKKLLDVGTSSKLIPLTRPSFYIHHLSIIFCFFILQFLVSIIAPLNIFMSIFQVKSLVASKRNIDIDLC